MSPRSSARRRCSAWCSPKLGGRSARASSTLIRIESAVEVLRRVAAAYPQAAPRRAASSASIGRAAAPHGAEAARCGLAELHRGRARVPRFRNSRHARALEAGARAKRAMRARRRCGRSTAEYCRLRVCLRGRYFGAGPAAARHPTEAVVVNVACVPQVHALEASISNLWDTLDNSPAHRPKSSCPARITLLAAPIGGFDWPPITAWACEPCCSSSMPFPGPSPIKRGT